MALRQVGSNPGAPRDKGRDRHEDGRSPGQQGLDITPKVLSDLSREDTGWR